MAGDEVNITALAELITGLEIKVDELEGLQAERRHSMIEAVNSIWLFVAFAELVTMHVGFAMREAGLVREMSMVTTYAKNLLGMAQNAMMALLGTYNLAYPNAEEFLLLLDGTYVDHSFRKEMGFHMMAQTMTCSIISGSMAERTSVAGAFLYNSFVALLQAGAVRVTWGGGFLAQLSTPFYDEAGAGPVHVVGGTAALMGALIVGSRKRRWNPEEAGSFVPHSLTMSTSGIMLIWCGWYGYIFVAQKIIHSAQGSSDVSMASVNATIASAMSGLCAVLFSLWRSRGERIDMIQMSNSIIAGLVATSGAGASMDLRYSIVAGCVASFLAVACVNLLKHYHIDDVSDAFSVHGICGIWGVLVTGFFHKKDGLFISGKPDLLFSQLFGLVFLLGWAGMVGSFGLIVLRLLKMLRVPSTVEAVGLDKTLGFDAYARSAQELTALRQAAGVLERCHHTPGEVCGALHQLKRIINRPFTPNAGAKRKEGEVSDILEQLDPTEFDDNANCFILLVHDKKDGHTPGKDFADIVETLLGKKLPDRKAHLLHHKFVNMTSNEHQDPTKRIEGVERAQNVVILLTKNVFMNAWCMAEVVHASCAGKRLLCVHVEFQDHDNDPRAFKFPQDVDRVSMKWQELVDETGEEITVMSSMSRGSLGSDEKLKGRVRKGRRGKTKSKTSSASDGSEDDAESVSLVKTLSHHISSISKKGSERSLKSPSATSASGSDK